MANTFAKIPKAFVGLSMTIVTIRRPILVLHLEAKNAKIDCKNEIYVKKLSKEHLDCKVNFDRKSTVNHKRSQHSTPTNSL